MRIPLSSIPEPRHDTNIKHQYTTIKTSYNKTPLSNVRNDITAKHFQNVNRNKVVQKLIPEQETARDISNEDDLVSSQETRNSDVQIQEQPSTQTAIQTPFSNFETKLRTKMSQQNNSSPIKRKSLSLIDEIRKRSFRDKDRYEKLSAWENCQETTLNGLRGNSQVRNVKSNLKGEKIIARANQSPQSKSNLFEEAYRLFMKKDYEASVYKFQMVLQNNENHVYANFYCGYINFKELKNYKCALGYLKKSLKLGHSKSAYFLGLIYAEGLDISRNEEIALAYFEYAGKKGHPLSMFRAAVHRLSFARQDTDYCISKAWLDKAVHHGIEDLIQKKEIDAYYQMIEGMRTLHLVKHTFHVNRPTPKKEELPEATPSLFGNNNLDFPRDPSHQMSPVSSTSIITKRYTFPDTDS